MGNWRFKLKGRAKRKKPSQKSVRSALRRSRQMRRWKAKVIDAHPPKCMWCGTEESLEVDHATPFSVLCDRHGIRKYKQGLKCSALWDPGNGAILCWECHFQKTLEDCDLYGWPRQRIEALFSRR